MVGKTAPGMRLGTLLVTLALVLSACSGDDATPETSVATTVPTTTTTTTPTTAPPTTAAPTTTAAQVTTTAPTPTEDPLARPGVLVSNFDRESVDDFDTTGDDLYRIALELDDMFNFLEGQPEGTGEEMVSLMYEPTYPYWVDLVGAFNELAENEWRYVDAGMETTGIDVLERTGNTASIRLTSRRGEQVIVDATGAEVKRIPGWELDIATFAIQRGPDGRWRYSNVSEFKAPTDEDLDRLVPVEWIGRTP